MPLGTHMAELGIVVQVILEKLLRPIRFER